MPSIAAYDVELAFKQPRGSRLVRVYAYNAGDAALQAALEAGAEIERVLRISPPVELCALASAELAEAVARAIAPIKEAAAAARKKTDAR